MRLPSSKLVLLCLYTVAALALVGAALFFAASKDELTKPAARAPIVAEATSFEAFQSPEPVSHALENDAENGAENGAENDALSDEELLELATEDIPLEEWEVLEPVDPALAMANSSEAPREVAAAESTAESTAETVPLAVGQSRQSRQSRQRMATLVVITNFEKANVTVNGLHYPSYSENGENEGIRVPAGGPHHVRVNYNGNEKLYEVFLQANERRFLMVELTGFAGGPGPAPRRIQAPPIAERTPDERGGDEDGGGRVTVYSRPRGQIIISGSDKGQATPGTIEVEAGRHDVQVRYEDGEISEKKVVRVRQGSRIKLFFRQE